ncbi:EboA domain-containing protein [Agaribacter flavus]|uniref:EboA domain-containing protein n=1 Tax=Agaribacter flavus TaxID=1902781 RepID=A0ABV7FM56_9ALTE
MALDVTIRVSVREQLGVIWHTQMSTKERDWLLKGFDCLKNTDDPINELLNLSASVNRQIQSDVTFSALGHCSSSELVRIALVLEVLVSHQELSFKKLAKAYYQYGDSQEKCALLKGFDVFDNNGEALDTALRATRCNSREEFAALALNNAYPSKHFEELNFNQLVLKALHQGLDISNLLGLPQRINEALVNMCFSYVVEQALAERIPPASIWMAIRYTDLSDEHKLVFKKYCQHFIDRDKGHEDHIRAQIELQGIQNVPM